MSYPPTVIFDTGAHRGIQQIVLGEQCKEDLERFCRLLNSAEHPELRGHLRELVKAWQESGPNLEKMMRGSHRHLLDYFTELCSTVIWAPQVGGRAMVGIGTNPDRLAELVGQERVYRPKPDGTPGPDDTWTLNPEAEAWIDFCFFTLNPHCEKLAGPCARCGNYYVKKRASQKVYCSRRCGNAATAVVRTRAKLDEEHKKKMLLAKALIRKWNALKGRSGLVWKEWLRKQEPSITDKFVTRRVNTGELPEPKAGRKA
ncbi:MAG: hypothetical protein WA602_05690 [Silvibacterium sp.]